MAPRLLRVLFAMCVLGAACSDDPGGSGKAAGGVRHVCDRAAGVDRRSTTGRWNDLAPLARGPRQETAVVELGGKIYVLGGFTPAGIVDTVEVYDPAADTWSTAASLPEPVHHANAAAHRGKIYVLGFLSTEQFVARGKGFAYDPEADTWSPVASMPAGIERGASATAAVGNKILVAGGFRAGAVDEAALYDPKTDSWEAIAPLPVARDHGVGASVGGIFFSIAGRNANIGKFMSDTYAFDPARKAWCELAPMPTARGGIAAAVVNGRIVVVGGEGNAADPNGVFSQVEAFDPATNRWSFLTPLPVGRHGTGAAAVGDMLYLPGGADHQAFGAVATMTSFKP